jgi:hypothetical protein
MSFWNAMGREDFRIDASAFLSRISFSVSNQAIHSFTYFTVVVGFSLNYYNSIEISLLLLSHLIRLDPELLLNRWTAYAVSQLPCRRYVL